MKIIVADDERLALEQLIYTIREVATDAEIYGFNEPEELMDFAKDNPCDVAFLDIEMGTMSGLEIAKQLKLWNPKITIILVTAYDQYMAPAVFEDMHYEYVQEHLRILSAFYGVLKPMDGVTPYRLEMQAKAAIGGAKNLYEYWGNSLYHEVRDDTGIIINLASKEYSRCIEKYLSPEDTYLTITFCELSGERMVTKGTYAKMARGEMVRFMAEHKIEKPEDIKEFDRLGYVFRHDLSSEVEYVFERVID